MSGPEHMYYPDLPCWCGGMPAFGEPHRVTGRHEAPPLGSAARDATAPPYHGRHRYVDDGSKGINLPPDQQRWNGTGFDERAGRVADERWSDPEDTHQGGPDDV